MREPLYPPTDTAGNPNEHVCGRDGVYYDTIKDYCVYMNLQSEIDYNYGWDGFLFCDKLVCKDELECCERHCDYVAFESVCDEAFKLMEVKADFCSYKCS